MERYIAFDVETPNARNHRMSAIGVNVVEDGLVTESFGTLVNPETHFDPFNIALTGITPELVRTAPSFPQLWDQIGPILLSGVLVAHNATFDLCVLSRCLQHYEIDSPQFVPFVCTVQMGRKCHPEMPNHKLDTLCRNLGIPLDHHRADSDSRACAELLLDYERNGLEIGHFVRTYDLWNGCTARL